MNPKYKIGDKVNYFYIEKEKSGNIQLNIEKNLIIKSIEISEDECVYWTKSEHKCSTKENLFTDEELKERLKLLHDELLKM